MCHILPKIKIAAFFASAALLGSLQTAKAQGFYFYNDRYMEPPVVMELGLAVGGMNCMTDIQGNKKGKQNAFGDITLKNTNFTAGLYLAGVYKDYIAVRLDYNYGKVEAYDSMLKGATDPFVLGRYVRNLNFRSNIREFALAVEAHPLYFKDYVEKGVEPPRWSPYFIGGVGIVTYRPYALVGSSWVDLKPLRLEGQGFAEYKDRKKYKNSTLCFPFGIGLKWEATQLFTLRLELTKRWTRSDYIDDVSKGDWVDPNLFANYLSSRQAAMARQLYNRSTVINPPRNTRPRGHDDENDAYWTCVFKLGFNINRRNYR